MINTSEAEFEALVWAAYRARDEGQDQYARTLDKLARKINADLTRRDSKQVPDPFGLRQIHKTPFGWQDVPSVFDK